MDTHTIIVSRGPILPFLWNKVN